MTPPFIITIDGPAGSGKGTLARALAAHFGFEHLDTGKIYRRVGYDLLKSGQDPHHEPSAVIAANKLTASLTPEMLSDPALREDAAGNAGSVVASMASVRAALLEAQRQFAQRAVKGAVLDGRDCGTVICPEAPVKFFVIARPDIRARRRVDELSAIGIIAVYDDVLKDILARDERDTNRPIAPLKPAPDAILLDTSDISAEAVLDRALSFIRHED